MLMVFMVDIGWYVDRLWLILVSINGFDRLILGFMDVEWIWSWLDVD